MNFDMALSRFLLHPGDDDLNENLKSFPQRISSLLLIETTIFIVSLLFISYTVLLGDVLRLTGQSSTWIVSIG